MAKSREINMNLPSVDDLFTTQEEREQKNQEYVKDISIYEITDFPNHPFKVKMDDKMLETIESVRDHGVLVPALVREKPTEYSCAAEPPVRCGVSHLSRRNEPLYN